MRPIEKPVAMKRNEEQPPQREISKPIKKSNSKIRSTIILLALKLTAVTLIQTANSLNHATANNFAGQLVLNFSPKSNSSSISSSYQKSFPTNHRMMNDDRLESNVSTISPRIAQVQNRTGWQIFEGSGQETIIRPQVAVQIFASPMEAPVANRSINSRRPSATFMSDNSRRYTSSIPSKRLNSIQADHQAEVSLSDQWQHQTRDSPTISAFIPVASQDETASTNTHDRRPHSNTGGLQFETSKLNRLDDASNRSGDFTDIDGNIEFSMNLSGDEIVINPVTSNLPSSVVGDEPQADIRTNFALADLVSTTSDDEIGASASSNNYNESQGTDTGKKSHRWRRKRPGSHSNASMDESMSSSSRQDIRMVKSRRQPLDEDEHLDDDFDGGMAAASNSEIADESLSEATGDSNELDDERSDHPGFNQQHSETDDETERTPRSNQARRKSRSSPSQLDTTQDSSNYEHPEDKLGQDQEEVPKSNSITNIRGRPAKNKLAIMKKRRLQLAEKKLVGERDLESYSKKAENGPRKSVSMSQARQRARDGGRPSSSNDDPPTREELESDGRYQRVASSSAPKLVIKGDDLKKFEQLLENLRSLSFAAGVGSGAKIQNRARKLNPNEDDDQLDDHPDSKRASTPSRQHQANSSSNQKAGQVYRNYPKANNSLRDCLRRYDRQNRATEVVLTREDSDERVESESEGSDDSGNRDGSAWRASGQETTNKTLSGESQNKDSQSSTTFENNSEPDSGDFSEEQQDASNSIGTRQLQPDSLSQATETIPTPEALFYRKTILQSYSEDMNRPLSGASPQESVDNQISYKSNSKGGHTPDEQTKQHDYDSQLAQSDANAKASEPKIRNTFMIQDVPLEDKGKTRAHDDRQNLSHNQLEDPDAYQSSESRPASNIAAKV